MKNRWRFNLWLLLQCIIVICFYAAYTRGHDVIQLLYQYDITFISFGILSLYVLSSLWIGIHTLFGMQREVCDWPIFISENLVTLGMLGTLIGLMVAIGSLFGLDLTNAADAAIGIQKMATGVSIAMVTTLVGIISSLLLKIQLMLWDKTLTAVEHAFFTSD